jgi:hypothetical protein
MPSLAAATTKVVIHLSCSNLVDTQAAAKKLVMAGALAEPVDGALFIFKDLSKEV